ncbi:glycosyltransferase family 2 protein [Winogradskyella poriferorum]|uniref:glycosyltransferase family 2 protein n=1 Tax=Winogradskyella poriferorum TaxID=307627 RepID=UPI003D64C6CA
MHPLVSIVTPIFNKATVIEETLESILNQTYKNWELLLVDDASTDNSAEVVNGYIQKDERIKYFEFSENKGAAEARNKGTQMATGDFIAFLDADDLWHKSKLEIQIDLMLNENIDVCFGSYELIDHQSNPQKIKVNALQTLYYNKLIKANYIGNLTGIYNCKNLGKIYTKDLKKRQDWLLWIEALKRSDKPAKGIKETIAYYRNANNSLSSNKFNLIKYNYNVYRKGLNFGIFKSTVYLLRFFIEHFFVKKKLIQPIA